MISQEQRQQARDAGRKALEEGQVHLYDLTGTMDKLGIAQDLRGAWLAGVEDALTDRGCDVDPESDGYEWERRALARAG